MTRARAIAIACLLAAGPAVAWAQPDPDAGVADPLDGGGPSDAAPAGPDAGTRILIDGPTMLGIGRPQVSAMAAPSEVRLGDKLTLFIEVTYDEQVTVSVPSGLDLQPVFDELRRSSVDERRSDGTRKRIYQLQLQVWELGDLRIPPIQVSYTVGGQSSWVVTNDVPIRVVGSIASIDDPNAFLGAAPPVELRRHDWRWIAAGIALGMFAITGLVAWLITRWRRRPLEPVAPSSAEVAEAIDREAGSRDDGAAPAIQAAPTQAAAAPFTLQLFVVTHELRRRLGDAARQALDALDALERAGTLASDQPEGFRQLVAIIHTFSVEQFHLPPRHRTTSDLLGALGRSPMPPDALTAATGWLERCDRVKFAADRVDDAGARALSDARELIVLSAGIPIPLEAAS